MFRSGDPYRRHMEWRDEECAFLGTRRLMALARKTGRAIKSVLSYTESLTTHNSRHSAYMTLRSALDADGRFLAHAMDVVFDGGAYAATKIGPGVLPGGVFQGMSPYRVPHVRMEARAASKIVGYDSFIHS